jgi:hypothetical protein
MRFQWTKILLAGCILNGLAAMAGATDLIVNDGFTGGLGQWTVNPRLPVTASWPWSAAAGAVNLHPPTEGFTGTVVYQNVNIANIGGKSVHFQMKLTRSFAPDGSTVAVYLTYVDTDNVTHREKILNPVNSTVPMDPNLPGAIFQTDYLFPANARKIVKLEIAKENYGDFTVDDISLTTNDSVTVGALPIIAGLSSASGPYGATLTVSGSGFGGAPGSVAIGGSSHGVGITSWSNTSIGVSIQEPARSGAVTVVADFVESNIDKAFTVTSPHFTVDAVNPTVKVVKGQTAEITVKTNFYNGFATTGGITFIVPEISSGVTFAPVPLQHSGGVLLRIDTSGLAPGVYPAHVQSIEGTSYARFAPFTLTIVTIADVTFFNTTPTEKTAITSKTISYQGQFGTNMSSKPSESHVSYEVTDSTGARLENDAIALRSSNPAVIGAYPRYWGYDLYALANGSADLIPVGPDGADITAEKLPVTVAVPPADDQFTSVTLFPQPVSNKGTQDITFQAASTGYISGIGMDMSGMMNFQTSFLDNYNYTDCDGFYQSACRTVQSIFQMTNTPSDLGTAVVYASSGTSKVALPLTTVNDGSYSGLRCALKPLDGSVPPHMEMFDLEFYRSGDTDPYFTKNIWSMGAGTGKMIAIGGIEPGAYKVKFVPAMPAIQPQFYPNATDVADALLVDFNAGQFSEMLFFPAGIGPIKADINTDGSVDLTDLVLVLQVLTGMTPLKAVSAAADINGNGRIDLSEALYLLQHLAAIR